MLFSSICLKGFEYFLAKKYSYFIDTLGAFSQHTDVLTNNNSIKWVLEFLLTLQDTQLGTEFSFLLSFLLLLMTEKLWSSKHHPTHFLLQNHTDFTQTCHTTFSQCQDLARGWDSSTQCNKNPIWSSQGLGFHSGSAEPSPQIFLMSLFPELGESALFSYPHLQEAFIALGFEFWLDSTTPRKAEQTFTLQQLEAKPEETNSPPSAPLFHASLGSGRTGCLCLKLEFHKENPSVWGWGRLVECSPNLWDVWESHRALPGQAHTGWSQRKQLGLT